MQIEVIDIDKIHKYEKNAKRHPKKQIEQIKKSIQEFNYNDPIAIDENNMIIEGHGRFEALKQLGYKQVECIRLTHLSEQEKKAYILAHNKLNMETGFDDEILWDELDSIVDFKMDDFGFNLDKAFDNLFKENERVKTNNKYNPTKLTTTSSNARPTWKAVHSLLMASTGKPIGLTNTAIMKSRNLYGLLCE